MRCADGVVIVSDRRMVRGDEAFDEGGKIKDLGYALVAYAGLTGLAEDEFVPRVMNAARVARAQSIRELKYVVEDEVAEVRKRYKDKLGADAVVTALVAGLENLNYGKAVLYRVHSEGYAEVVKTYAILGSAMSLAMPVMKVAYDGDMTVEEGAKLGAFVVTLIEEFRLDRNVGGGVEIAFVRDSEGEVEKATEVLGAEDSKEYVERAKEMLKVYRTELRRIIMSGSGHQV